MVKLLRAIFLVELIEGLWVTFRTPHPQQARTDERPGLPGAPARDQTRFRAGLLHARRRNLRPTDARGRSQADSIQTLIDAVLFYAFAALPLGSALLTMPRRKAVHN